MDRAKQTVDWRNTKIEDVTSERASYGTSMLASSSLPSVPAKATSGMDFGPAPVSALGVVSARDFNKNHDPHSGS